MDNTKEFLINEYKDYIYSIANLFYGIDKEDLFQAGAEGLIESFYSYDDTSNVKFTTYAYKNVYGHMYALISKTNDFKISKDTWKLYKQIMEKYQELTQKNKQIPAMSEIAQELQISNYLLSATITACNKALSLESQVCDNKNYLDTIALEENVSLEDKIFLEESLENLTPLEKKVIKYRYYHDLTQAEIAKKLGLSQVKVSRCEKKSLDKLRVYAKE